MTNRDRLRRLVRTGLPVVWAALVVWAACRWGVAIPPEWEPFAVAAASAAIYAAVSALEERFASAGLLLGMRGLPSYQDSTEVVVAVKDDVAVLIGGLRDDPNFRL